MAYTDYDNLKLAIPEATLIELTDDVAAGAVDMAKVDGCIEAADSEIDGYIPEGIALPLNPVPRLIARLATVIAIYNIYARYCEAIPETRQSQYDNAIKMLRDLILTGKVTLRNDTPAAADDTQGGDSRYRVSSRRQRFTDDALEGF